jgi:hypothetical protein
MSSTRKRKHGAHSVANYPTPAWAVQRFVEAWDDFYDLDELGDRWLEPVVGDGTIVDVINKMNRSTTEILWTTVDIRDTTAALQAIGLSYDEILIGNFFDLLETELRARRWDVAIFNPPFHLSFDFVMRCRAFAKTVVVFQSLNFLGSSDRNEWIRYDVPDTYVIPDRVSHTGDGKTDSVYSAWYVWDGAPKQEGKFKVLQCTDLDIRKREQERARRLRDERAITLDSMIDVIE